MPRGRKKDITIPPTRALTQQRDYRARKAHYVAELEERCRRLEEENVRLRKDLDLARASLPVSSLSNTLAIDLSAELLQNINALTTSLAKFHDFAQQHPLQAAGPSKDVQLPPIQDCSLPDSAHDLLHSQSLSPLPPSTLRAPSDVAPLRGSEQLRRENSPSSTSISNSANASSRYHHGTSSPEYDCCDGIFDCTEFCEGEHSPNHTRYLQSEERLLVQYPKPNST